MQKLTKNLSFYKCTQIYLIFIILLLSSCKQASNPTAPSVYNTATSIVIVNTFTPTIIATLTYTNISTVISTNTTAATSTLTCTPSVIMTSTYTQTQSPISSADFYGGKPYVAFKDSINGGKLTVVMYEGTY